MTEVPSGSADVFATGVLSGWTTPLAGLAVLGELDAVAEGPAGVGLRVGKRPDALPPGLSTEPAPETDAIPGRPPAAGCELPGSAPGDAVLAGAAGVLVACGRIAFFFAAGAVVFGPADFAAGGAVTATVADALASCDRTAALTSAARLTELPAAASLGTVSWT
jgi:hypothetical protein